MMPLTHWNRHKLLFCSMRCRVWRAALLPPLLPQVLPLLLRPVFMLGPPLLLLASIRFFALHLCDTAVARL
jgi:hypothetical protein